MSEPVKREAVLMIGRDGPVIAIPDPQSFEDLVWTPGVFHSLQAIVREGRYHLVLLVSRTLDGRERLVHERIVETLAGEGIVFDDVLFGQEDLWRYGEAKNDHTASMVVAAEPCAAADMLKWQPVVFTRWSDLMPVLTEDRSAIHRTADIRRVTKETSVSLSLDLDGTGKADIDTALPFFDHMLHQIFRHGRIDASLSVKGDLEVDEHHSVEDAAIVLGQAIGTALADKRGIERYGFEILPMDDCLAQVAVDFSGRPWLVWDVTFTRDMVGSFPTELLFHFFKSFSDEARCNLYMTVSAGNTHHQAEALCKAFGRALRAAVFRRPGSNELPSTKGIL